jgi:hypothetical protein
LTNRAALANIAYMKRREHAWAVADVRSEDEPVRRRRAEQRDATRWIRAVLAVLVTLGAGVAAWQLVSLLR